MPCTVKHLVSIVPHGQPRVQARVRILEDDLHLPPQLRASRANGSPVISGPSNLTLPDGRLDQPQDAAPGRRLAAAALPHEPEHFALLHRERDAVDGAHVPDGAREQALLDRESTS